MNVDGQCLGFLIGDTARLYSKLFRERLEMLSLERCHYRALLILQANPDILQSRLAELCGIGAGPMSRTIDRLERLGWIKRRPHPHDRRAHLLAITQTAVPFLEQFSDVIAKAQREALRNFSSDEMRALWSLLKQVHANLSASVGADADLSP